MIHADEYGLEMLVDDKNGSKMMIVMERKNGIEKVCRVLILSWDLGYMFGNNIEIYLPGLSA